MKSALATASASRRSNSMHGTTPRPSSGRALSITCSGTWRLVPWTRAKLRSKLLDELLMADVDVAAKETALEVARSVVDHAESNVRVARESLIAAERQVIEVSDRDAWDSVIEIAGVRGLVDRLRERFGESPAGQGAAELFDAVNETIRGCSVRSECVPPRYRGFRGEGGSAGERRGCRRGRSGRAACRMGSRIAGERSDARRVGGRRRRRGRSAEGRQQLADSCERTC